MRQASFAVFLSAAVAVVVVLAGTTDDSIDDRKYVEYAKGFATYTARLTVPCGEKRCEATATLISGHWALTAAHVVGDANSATLTIAGKSWEIGRIVKHPEFKDDSMGRNDIALLHSKDSFALDFYPALSDGHEEPGDIVSIAGYGVHGKMSAGHDKHDNALRAGTNHVERFERDMIVCSASPGRSPLEICIAPGDSGGPLFCRGKLAGVNCITMAPKGPLKSRSGEESGHVRVWLYRDWIDEVTK